MNSVESDVIRLVTDLDARYQAAVARNDVAEMDRLLADDFVLVVGSGKSFSKADLLEEARSGRFQYQPAGRQRANGPRVGRYRGHYRQAVGQGFGEWETVRIPCLVQRYLRPHADRMADKSLDSRACAFLDKGKIPVGGAN